MRKVWIAIVISMFALAVTPVLAAELVGTNGPDLLNGSDLDDTIHGFNGADMLDGRAGDDSLFTNINGSSFQGLPVNLLGSIRAKSHS